MNKLKDLFSPGHKEDADVLYGSQQSDTPSSHASQTGRPSGEGSHLGNPRDTPEVASSGLASHLGTAKGHNRSDTMEPVESRTAPDSAARQTTNPAGTRRDDARYGREEPATTSLPDRTAGATHSTSGRDTDISSKHETLDPRHNETRHDNAGTMDPTPTRFSQGGVLEPVGGVSVSSEHGQGIVGAQNPPGNRRPSTFTNKDDTSVASVRAGIIGETPHAKHLTDSDLPAGAHDTSRSGRGVGPGTGAAAAGTAAVLGSNTERSFPLSGGTSTDTSGTRGNYASRNEPATFGSTTGPSTVGTTHGSGNEHGSVEEFGASRSTGFDNHKHKGNFHQYQGPNTDHTNNGPRFTEGPHATEAGNLLDPSVPSSKMPGAYPDSASATPATEEPQSFMEPSSREHHYGRDAALAGAGAAAAGGVYEERHTGSADADPTRAGDRTERISSQDYGSDAARSGARTTAGGLHDTHHREPTETAYLPQSETTRDTPGQGHHYGRDAALAGAGAGAAGGLYETRRKGSTDTDPASLTHGPHKSNLANIADPRVLPDPNKMKGHQAQSTETDPASKTVGPHSSNIANVVDPRVLPQPEKMKQHTTAGPHQSDALNRADPRVDSDPANAAGQHHYGRDAAIAGGLGAGAAGAYGASQHRNEKNPYTSQAIDPRVGGRSSASGIPVRNTSTKSSWYAGPTGSAVDAKQNAPTSSTRATGSTGFDQYSTAQPSQQHHYGRDAALAGGAGLTGAGLAHQYDEHKTGREQAPGTTDTSRSQPSAIPQPTTSGTSATRQPQTSSTSQPTSQHHYGRDAALAGGAGAAGAGAAYEYHNREPHPYGTTAPTTQPTSQHRAEPATTFDELEQKQHHSRDPAAASTAAGLAGVGAEHEARKHEAEKAAKERLEEEKKWEKEEKKHQKELEKEHKKQEKEVEKEEKKKHGGGLFGFLHRDKSDEKVDEPIEKHPRESVEKHHRAEEAAGAAALGGAGAAAYEHENDKHDRNRLHKDPPADYVRAHDGEHYGTDGRIGEAGAAPGFQETRRGDYDTYQRGDQEGIVIEPHTGLPMNVGKYGSGAGGTDANEPIRGYHTHDAGAQGTGTDWQNIKKANTPY